MHPTAARLQTRLAADGLAIEVVTLTDSARTVALAAAALGCEVGQIVKSLVFVRGGEPLMVLCAGDRRVAAASTPRDVFEVETEALIAAIPDARVLPVS